MNNSVGPYTFTVVTIGAALSTVPAAVPSSSRKSRYPGGAVALGTTSGHLLRYILVPMPKCFRCQISVPRDGPGGAEGDLHRGTLPPRAFLPTRLRLL
jgi:hypothetical protein